MIRAVVFDVGETLVDETRQWALWADWLGVPRDEFSMAFHDVIASGAHHRRVFDHFAPGLDVDAAERARVEAGRGYTIEPRDFYPDALPCLAALRSQRLMVGIAGNQPEAAEAALHACGTSVDFIATSSGWGIEKPSPLFFERIADVAGLPPCAIAYVGDRLDNDIIPARNAGMVAIFLRRGPWGLAHANSPDIGRASARIEALAALPTLIRQLNHR
ncbi:MAG: HAD family hydrolase [Sphingomonas sp.]|nr:HAD family hydrolase [Sphingomonas sp.]